MFTRSLLSAAATLFILAAMPSFALAAVVTVWLGLFCGLAWVSGYTLLQENVEDEYRGRTFASLTVLSRLGLFASLTFFPILSSVYDSAVYGTTEPPTAMASSSPERASRSGWRGSWSSPPASTPAGSCGGSGSAVPNPSRSCRS